MIIIIHYNSDERKLADLASVYICNKVSELPLVSMYPGRISILAERVDNVSAAVRSCRVTRGVQEVCRRCGPRSAAAVCRHA